MFDVLGGFGSRRGHSGNNKTRISYIDVHVQKTRSGHSGDIMTRNFYIDVAVLGAHRSLKVLAVFGVLGARFLSDAGFGRFCFQPG